MSIRKKINPIFLLSFLLLFLVASCSYDEIVKKFEPKEESAFAKQYLQNLRDRNFDEVKKYLSSELLTPDVDARLLEVADYFPEGDPLEVKTVGVHVFTTPKSKTTNMSYEYRFANGWALADIVLADEGNGLFVKGVHVNKLPQSLEETNAFTLAGKTVIHYFFLLTIFVIPIFILYSLIVCIKTPMRRRKWLWILFILIGVEGIHLNWTTGQVWLQFFSIHLLGSGAIKGSPFSPWIMTISIPLGAILFLARRKKLMKVDPPAVTLENVDSVEEGDF